MFHFPFSLLLLTLKNGKTLLSEMDFTHQYKGNPVSTSIWLVRKNTKNNQLLYWNPFHLRIFRCYDSPQWSYEEKDSVAMANNGLKIVLFFTLCPNHCCVGTMLLPNLNCLNNSFYSYGVSSPFGEGQLKQQPCMEHKNLQTTNYLIFD